MIGLDTTSTSTDVLHCDLPDHVLNLDGKLGEEVEILKASRFLGSLRFLRCL